MARPRRAWQQVGRPRVCGGDSHVTSQSRCTRPGRPRVCGERGVWSGRILPTPTSSPRVRGTGVGAPSPSTSAPGHPCVCGEHLRSASDPSTVPGSSLRVRGTSALGVRSVDGSRVVPACAGNGEDYGSERLDSPCHPCVYRKRRPVRVAGSTLCVSSLRVRGTALPGRRMYSSYRVIPLLRVRGTMPASHPAPRLFPGHP